MYKIAVLGSAGVGKTTYLNRLAGKAFSAPWRETGVREDRTLIFNTNYGPFSLQFNDYSGARTYDGKGINTDVDGVFYMYDVTNRVSLKSLNMYRSLFSSYPSVLLANKIDIDISDHKVIGEPHHPSDIEFTKISTKKSINLLTPIQNLLKKLTGHEDLEIK